MLLPENLNRLKRQLEKSIADGTSATPLDQALLDELVEVEEKLVNPFGDVLKSFRTGLGTGPKADIGLGTTKKRPPCERCGRPY
jgi:hypothetical protein